jgi:hypothetical protein
MKNKILILCCMVPMIAETAVDKSEYTHRFSETSTVNVDQLVADSQSAPSAPSRFTALKSTVSNAWNKTAGRGLNFVGTQCSNGVQSVKDAGNSLSTATQAGINNSLMVSNSEILPVSLKTKAMSFATAANNDRKSSAIVTGVALAAVVVACGAVKATAKMVQWLRNRKLTNLCNKSALTEADKQVIKAGYISFLNGRTNTIAERTAFVNKFVGSENVERCRAIRNIIVKAKKAVKPSVSLASRAKAGISKVWNKIPSFRKA